MTLQQHCVSCATGLGCQSPAHAALRVHAMIRIANAVQKAASVMHVPPTHQVIMPASVSWNNAPCNAAFRCARDYLLLPYMLGPRLPEWPKCFPPPTKVNSKPPMEPPPALKGPKDMPPPPPRRPPPAMSILICILQLNHILHSMSFCFARSFCS